MNKNDKPLWHEFNQYLSFLDLEKLDDWEEAFKGQNEELFNEILYKHGCDPEYGYGIETSLHRPRTENKIEYGPVIRFKERSDKEFEPYKAVEDICRDHPSSTVRAGMRESLNNGVNLNDLIEEQLSTHAKLLDIKHEEKENKGEK